MLKKRIEEKNISFLVSFFIPIIGLCIAVNVFGLCVRAGFVAQSLNLLLKFNRCKKLQICTSARLAQNGTADCGRA